MVEVAIPMKELFTMFRSGVAAFLKAGALTDTVCLEERKALPAAIKNRSSCGWLLDDCDLDNLRLSDDGWSYASEEGDGDDVGGSDSNGGNLLDEMDEEEVEEIEEDDNEGKLLQFVEEASVSG